MGDSYERQQVAYLVVRQRWNHPQFVERLERMFVGVHEDVIYLLRREEMELAQFLVGGVIEVDGRLV